MLHEQRASQEKTLRKMPDSARQFITDSQFPFGLLHGNNLVLRETKFS